MSGIYHRPNARSAPFAAGYPVRNRRKRRPGRPNTVDKRAWELLSLLRSSEGAASAAIKRDLRLTSAQLARTVRRAREILDAVGGEIVVERRSLGTVNGGPSWAYAYRTTVSMSEAVRMLGESE